MTVFVTVVRVRPTVVTHIFASTFHSVLEASLLDFAAPARPHIPAATIRLAHLRSRPTIHLRYGLLIAAPEGVSVLPSQFVWDVRMAVLIAVVRIWPTMVTHIFMGAIHPVLKTSLLDFVTSPQAHILDPTILAIAGIVGSRRHAICAGRA
jgi:hypothetical protein